MFVIGLAGGVGSGKSLVANRIKEKTGAHLLLADHLGHQMMKKGCTGYERIVAEFGKEMLSSDGEIDRTRLSQLVFGRPERLEVLNQIIHPLVKDFIQDYIQTRKQENGIILLESAIIFESGCDVYCDELWYVWVPEAIRKKRLAESRGYSEAKSEAIMRQQMSEEEFRKRCHRVIKNDVTLEKLDNVLDDICNGLLFDLQ